MLNLEDTQPGASLRGILPDQLVAVGKTEWCGSEALELTYRDAAGWVAKGLLYRHEEQRLEVVKPGRSRSFDGDGALFRLVSEAHRIKMAHQRLEALKPALLSELKA